MTVVKGRGSTKWVALVVGVVGVGALVAVVLKEPDDRPDVDASIAPVSQQADRKPTIDTVLATGRAPKSNGLSGTWVYRSGNLVTTCNGQAQTKDAAGSSFELQEVAGKPGVFAYSKDGCDLELQQAGNALSMRARKTCKTGELSVDYLTANLKGDESGADIEVTGTLAGSWGKQQANCEFKSTGRVARK
jgi:hypothetical protein